MESNLSTQLTSLQGARTQYSAQVSMVKANSQADMATAVMLDEAVRAAPPAGQGTKVDKTA